VNEWKTIKWISFQDEIAQMESTTECTWRQNDLQLRSTEWNLLFEFFWIFFFGSNVLNVTSWFDFCWTRMTRRFFPPRFEINSKWVLFKCTKQCHKIVSFKKMLLFIDVAIYNARLALRDLLWSGFSFRLWSFSHVRTAEVEIKCARHQERSFGLRWKRTANILIERRISSPSAAECWTRKKDFTQKWFVHSFNQWALVKIAAQISRIFDWLSVSFLNNQSWKLKK
jgi:hypothetical protein